MFKMDDFEDTFVYSVFLFLSAIVSLLVYLLLFSIIGFIGEPLSEFFGKDWNPFLRNSQISIFIFLFLILFYFFLFYFFYNLRNFVPDSKFYIKRLFFFSLIYLILIAVLKWIGQYLFNFDIYLLNSIILFLYLISIMFFWVFFIPFIFIIKDFILPQKYNNAIERNFRAAQYELEKIIEESDKNENSNLEKFIVKKKLLDIYSVANYYTYGIKTLKKSFGNAINFDKINYLNLNNRENLNEILDHLAISIPFYIFYGRIEQMREMDTHLKNISECLGDRYSIAGEPFMAEILRMNDKVDKYFRDNSFEFSNNENRNISKYNYYMKRIFLAMLTIVSSIILSYFVVPSFK